MTDSSRSPEADAAQEASAADRRRAERFATDVETACQPVGPLGGSAWPARIQNVSQTGLALVSDRRFERGTLLSVDLEDPEGGAARTVLARVVHVRAQEDGLWFMGCAFASELEAEELKQLHAER